MRSPIIIEGAAFPWHEPNPKGPVVSERGDVNWAAAAWADPGVMRCPKCRVYLWREGIRVRCPDCGAEFETGNGALAKKLAAPKGQKP